MLIVYKSLFTKDVQHVHHLHGHMPGDGSRLLNCSVNNAAPSLPTPCIRLDLVRGC